MTNSERKFTGTYADKLCTIEASPAERAEGEHNEYELQEAKDVKAAAAWSEA